MHREKKWLKPNANVKKEVIKMEPESNLEKRIEQLEGFAEDHERRIEDLEKNAVVKLKIEKIAKETERIADALEGMRKDSLYKK